MKNRILDRCYRGAESLAPAAEELLAHPFRYDMAVVRDIPAIVHDNWSVQSAIDTDENIARLYELVPELEIVDKAVREASDASHKANILGDKQVIPDQLTRAYVRGYDIKPHIDPDKRLILTGSARVDNNFSTQRTFWAHQEGITTFEGGTYSYDAQNILMGSAGLIKNLRRRQWPGHMSNVDQRPGDWVWILNHPNPAIHAVTSSRPDSKALITVYHSAKQD